MAQLKAHSPREGGREAAVVDPAGDDVEEVDGAGEVQAQLRPLHNVPQGQGTRVTNDNLISQKVIMAEYVN